MYDLQPTPIEINLTLLRKFLLKQAQEKGQKTLITVHHHVEEIHWVMVQVKKDGELHWWDILFGWSSKLIDT